MITNVILTLLVLAVFYGLYRLYKVEKKVDKSNHDSGEQPTEPDFSNPQIHPPKPKKVK